MAGADPDCKIGQAYRESTHLITRHSKLPEENLTNYKFLELTIPQKTVHVLGIISML